MPILNLLMCCVTKWSGTTSLAKTVCKSDKFVYISEVALHNCDDGLQAVMSQNELTSYPNPAVGVSNLVFTPVVSGRAIIEVYQPEWKASRNPTKFECG